MVSGKVRQQGKTGIGPKDALLFLSGKMAITGILRIFNGQIKRKPDPSNRRRMQSILIVEDEKRVADLLKTGLEENGYRVTVAYDGAMGLRLFRAQPFQLVVSDVVLPRMDGFELCREIRRIHAGVPILMLTALGTTDDKLDGFDAGADATWSNRSTSAS